MGSIRWKAVAWIAGLGLSLLLLSAVWHRSECWWYGYQTERETRYGAFVGCMVELEGKWFPRNELRVAQ